MEDAATDTNVQKGADMLGSFLFRGDDVRKRGSFPGGERNSALCKLLAMCV
jgi:ATPase subunit of ABC transporter with duplicated ATPase domains